MRIAVTGGLPQPVLEMPNNEGYWCARAPASICEFHGTSPDGKWFVITAFDPLQGRGKVLRTIEPPAHRMDYRTVLSPDGSTLFFTDPAATEIYTRLLSLSGGSDRG